MRFSFRFFIHSFIQLIYSHFVQLWDAEKYYWRLLKQTSLWLFGLILETEQGDVTFYLRQEVIFRLTFACLSVCLSVCPQDNSKTTAPILMKLCM